MVTYRLHVDKIADDLPTHLPQVQLAGHFIGRFQGGLQGGFFDVAAFGGAGGVNVDGHQRLGDIHDDGTTRGKFNFTLEGGFDLAFDLVTIEQREDRKRVV